MFPGENGFEIKKKYLQILNSHSILFCSYEFLSQCSTHSTHPYSFTNCVLADSINIQSYVHCEVCSLKSTFGKNLKNFIINFKTLFQYHTYIQYCRVCSHEKHIRQIFQELYNQIEDFISILYIYAI